MSGIQASVSETVIPEYHSNSILTCQFNLKFLNIYLKRKLYYYYKWNIVSVILDTRYSRYSSNNTREDSTHRHHQMANTEIRLIIFFAVKDGEALCSEQKYNLELTLAEIMSSLMQNSGLN